jgi:hypothetical protein
MAVPSQQRVMLLLVLEEVEVEVVVDAVCWTKRSYRGSWQQV